MNERIRKNPGNEPCFSIAVIGCGALSTRAHGPSLALYQARNPNVVLCACCDLVKERAHKYRETFGFSVAYTDYGKMLKEARPDAVLAIVPVDKTADIAVEVINAGVPVLMEKPPGLYPCQTKSIIEAAKRCGVPHAVAFNRRHVPVVTAVKQKIEQAGPICHIGYDFYRVGRNDEDFSTTAIHAVDTVRHLASSDFARISFTYVPTDSPTADIVLMQGVMQNKAAFDIRLLPGAGILMERATISAYNHTWFVKIASWEGTDFPGSLVYYYKGQKIRTETAETLSAPRTLIESAGFYQENACFFDDIRAGRSPKNDAQSAMQSVLVADALRKRQTHYHHLEQHLT